MNQAILNSLLGKGLKLPKGEISLRELTEFMLAGLHPTPEFISLPAQFMRKATTLISETNRDNRERAFPLISDTQNPLLIPNEKHWSIGDNQEVVVKLIHAEGVKNIGIYHTHPHLADLSSKASLHASVPDIVTFLKNPYFFYSIIGAPDGTFLMMLKTDKTPTDGSNPLEALLGNKNRMPANVEQTVSEIFQSNKSKFSGFLSSNWINLAMIEVKVKFGIEFYCSEPRANSNEAFSSLLCKVDVNDGGFRSHGRPNS